MASSRRAAAAFDDWAAWYDLVAGDRSATAAFYGGLVGGRTRSILELACGTGTITLAVARRLAECNGAGPGSRVVGIDESPEMLRLARAKSGRIAWLLGDMRAPPVDGLFDLVICCYNTVQQLLTDAELAAFFRAARALAAPGGTLAFDIVQPDLPALGGPQQEHVARTLEDERGRRLEHLRRFSYEPGSRILTIHHRLVEAGNGDRAVLAQLSFGYRQYFAAEIEQAAVAAGFAVRRRCGDFDGSPLEAASPKQVFVCAAA